MANPHLPFPRVHAYTKRKELNRATETGRDIYRGGERERWATMGADATETGNGRQRVGRR